MDKQNVVQPYNGIFGYKMEWSTDTCYNMDKPWEHIKWKQPVTKNCVLYDSTHTKVQNRELYRDKID